MGDPGPSRYKKLIAAVFQEAVPAGASEGEFAREQLAAAAARLGIELPRNLGDVIYAFRYRSEVPQEVIDSQPEGQEWIIEGAGRSSYRFRLVPVHRILPNPERMAIKVPDATPELVAAHALSDEQALLARVRYNRLIDVFLGLTAYSLQNHLRTAVSGLGQIEIDEVYVGVDRHGCQQVIPVQAKGGKDRLSTVQARQDLLCCEAKFPGLPCRAVAAQFMDAGRIAMFELGLDDSGAVRILDEEHYVLVAADEVSSEDQARYRQRSGRAVSSDPG